MKAVQHLKTVISFRGKCALVTNYHEDAKGNPILRIVYQDTGRITYIDGESPHIKSEVRP